MRTMRWMKISILQPMVLVVCCACLAGQEQDESKKDSAKTWADVLGGGSSQQAGKGSPQESQGDRLPKAQRRLINPQDYGPLHFKNIRASDGSFTVSIPFDWNVESATLDSFKTFTAAGEMVFVRKVEVLADPASYRQWAGLMQQWEMLTSPEMLVIQSRIISPPLSPADTVRFLYPRAAAGMIQNMTVVEGQNMAGPLGAPAALVHFTYTLAPNPRDPARILFPPVLLRQGNTAMEGAMLILLLPPNINGYYNVWSFIQIGAEGPVPLFRKNVGLYVAALGTLQYNSAILQQRIQAPWVNYDRLRNLIRAPFDNMFTNDPGYRRAIERTTAGLGGQVLYEDPQDPNWRGSLPVGSTPSRPYYAWRDAHGNVVTTEDAVPPGPGYDPVQPY